MLRTLARSTAFRLTGLLGGAFLLVMLGTGYTAFRLIWDELDERITIQLQQTFGVISQAYGDQDLTDLIEAVNSNMAANPELELVFQLLAPDGSVLAGNDIVGPDQPGWSLVSAEALGLLADKGMYRIYRGEVGDYDLLVGEGFAESESTAAIVVNSLMLAGAVFSVLIILGGVVVAARMQRRMQRIADTMTEVGRGELSARVPLSRNGDDLHDLSMQINAALERLAALVESMRQVSVDIAHDLKTPLNRLSFTVEEALDAAALGKPVSALLEQVQDEARQINTTFEALLRIAQIEAGARRSRFTAVSLEDILATLHDAYADVAEEHGQTLTLQAVSLPGITGDRDLLTQLFANLIENAINHCPPGTAIKLETRIDGKVLEVAIADNGPGIPAEEGEKVFRRLYRLDKSRSTPGSGLGLSLVKAIADLHHASIDLSDNRPGLRVTLRFASLG